MIVKIDRNKISMYKIQSGNSLKYGVTYLRNVTIISTVKVRNIKSVKSCHPWPFIDPSQVTGSSGTPALSRPCPGLPATHAIHSCTRQAKSSVVVTSFFHRLLQTVYKTPSQRFSRDRLWIYSITCDDFLINVTSHIWHQGYIPGVFELFSWRPKC